MRRLTTTLHLHIISISIGVYRNRHGNAAHSTLGRISIFFLNSRVRQRAQLVAEPNGIEGRDMGIGDWSTACHVTTSWRQFKTL